MDCTSTSFVVLQVFSYLPLYWAEIVFLLFILSKGIWKYYKLVFIFVYIMYIVSNRNQTHSRILNNIKTGPENLYLMNDVSVRP